MKILTIVGARPQFIKASPISRAFLSAKFDELILHTGQHYDQSMSQVFFDELGIPAPHINLEVGSGSHAQQTAAMLIGIENAILENKPDWVLIYGDTNSTLAGALAAVKLHVPVAHIEAGLRSYNRRMPEEINRIMADSVSDLLFVPTITAAKNLTEEGAPKDRIHLVGDVMYDAALLHSDKADQQSHILEVLGLEEKNFVLTTIHRAENTDDSARLKTIVDALCIVGKDIPIVMPLHPRTRAALERNALFANAQQNLRLIKPVGYLDMIKLEKSASLIATDSGGLQKEAFFQRTPCVTLRDETEWVEVVELGWNRLCAPDTISNVVDAIRSMIGTAGRNESPYGDGDASLKIAQILGSI